MRKTLIGIALVSVASPALWAQSRPVQAPAPGGGFGRIISPSGVTPGRAVNSAGTTVTGFGRVVFPGTAAPAVVRSTGISQVMNQPPQVQHPGHNSQIAVPYPVYFGGGYYNYGPPPPLFMENFDRPSKPDPNGLFQNNFSRSSSNGPQVGSLQDQSPVVIVNQYFTAETAPTPSPSPIAAAVKTVPQLSSPVVYSSEPEPVVYLIAMKDHTFYVASSYYVENETLKYTTTQGAQNTVSLDLVDRELSHRLNRERSVAFGLPSN